MANVNAYPLLRVNQGLNTFWSKECPGREELSSFHPQLAQSMAKVGPLAFFIRGIASLPYLIYLSVVSEELSSRYRSGFCFCFLYFS